MKILSAVVDRWPILFWTFVFALSTINAIGYNAPILMGLFIIASALWYYWGTVVIKAFGFITFLISLYGSLAFLSDLSHIQQLSLQPLWFIFAGGSLVALGFWSSIKMADMQNNSETPVE
ncbi:MAG: hypothetical protein KDC24_14835 [Saprospiraceae bacterium]|nr:hypothetical protein [Saprospiraceae bacterium]